MKCQVLFSRKNKKSISKCPLMKYLLSMQNVLFKQELKQIYTWNTTDNRIHIGLD